MTRSDVKAYVLISISLVWLGGVVLYFSFGRHAGIDLTGQAHPFAALLLAVLVIVSLEVGWLVPLSIGFLRLRKRRVLIPEKPVSLAQRRFNRSVLLLLPVAGTLFGLWEANRCAKILFGYVASYSFLAAFVLAILVSVVGVPPLIYWRTRWVGIGLIFAGLLSLLSFYGCIFALTKLDRVAWRHGQLVSFGPDQQASLVIYFCHGISDQQIENFRESVLQEPAEPRHAGRDFPAFVDSYMSLLPSQANGYEAVALIFRGEAASAQVRAYVKKIESDARVKKTFADVVPTSIRLDQNRGSDDNCR